MEIIKIDKWERLGYLGTFSDKQERDNTALEEAFKLI